MSALFNQTNIAPGSAFATGGGGASISTDYIQGLTTINNAIDLNNGGEGIRMATASSTFTVSYGSMGDTRISLLPVGGLKLGFFNPAGSPAPGAYWAVGNNIANSNWGINLNSLSSITANNAPQSINMNALVSTLASAYPGCVS